MSRERSRAGSRSSRFSRTMLAVCMGWGISLCSLSAHASRAVDEVAQLLEQGKGDQAAKQADSHLKQNPNDVEMRFMRGVIATEQKQSAQAIKIFSALTREFPSMPEPYNNLAVLYAADGQERKAAEALEQAIRTNPSYTTAHENLGDLYARMASEAYTKALQLDGSRPGIRPKLALITQLAPLQQAGAKTLVADAGTAPKPKADIKPEPKPEVKVAAAPAVPVAAPVAAPVAPAPAPQPAVVSSAPLAVATGKVAEPKPAAKAEVAVVKPAAAPVVTASAASTAATPAPAPAPVAAKTPAPAPEAPSKSAAQVAAAEVESAVNAWAAAWQKQDMHRYLDAYSDKFTPADGSSLANWKEARRVRIVGKNSIAVSIRNLNVKVDGDQATAQFRQHYVAGSLNTTTRKTLSLHREKGQWRILRETTGG